MKSIFNIVYVFLILGFFASCDDAIEIEQPGRFSAESAFQTVEDLQLGILGTYDELDITRDIMHSATFTDEISIGFDNGGQGLGDGRFGFILNSTSTAPTTIWNNNYDAINSATRVLEASTTITPEAGEEADYNAIRGQALAIRAFSHFQLFSHFTTDMTDPSALCVIAVDFVPNVADEFGRNTNAEVLALINSDLDAAFGLLPDGGNNPTFITKDFVTALRARLGAYTQDYASADANARLLMANYPLADPVEYVDMFTDNNNTEVIFKLERSIGDNYDTQATEGGGWAGALFAFVDPSISGSPYFEMGRSLFNLFDPSDARYSAVIHPTSVVDPDYTNSADFKNSDILVISKYPGSDGQPLLNDLKVFRSSEMVLIAAEAAAAGGDLAEAANLVKSIRDARFGSDQAVQTYTSASDAFKAILDERRIEFCYEGHRYRDLKRLGSRANAGVNRDPLDCAINGACTLASDDYRFTLPIPTVELNANSVIRDQQNPGY